MTQKKHKAASGSVPATDAFDFVYGRFNLNSKWAIPYFATTMTMGQAADSLSLVNDFPGNELLGWKIDELYQRDVDWGRVEREIVPYLSSSEEPQFFNSLTVALMPIRDKEARPTFEGDEWACPEFKDESLYDKKVEVGPITIGYFEDWNTSDDPGARVGHIRWNMQQVFCVAIDGQHRLAAIKTAKTKFDEGMNRTQVPVILLLLDERVGFRAPAGHKLVELMRTLFITLNKHARSVSRPRQLLLDDRDPHSLCVRALIGEQIVSGIKAAHPEELPLSLVDWHSEQAKFETGPYITTILGLDWIVEKTLRCKPIKDYFAYAAVNKQLRAFSVSLGLKFHRPDSPTFKRFAETKKQAIEPFSYLGYWSHDEHEGELGELVEAFRSTWAQALVEVLMHFSPYAHLISLRKESSSLSPEFINWYYLRENKGGSVRATNDFANFEKQLKHRKKDPIPIGAFEDHLAAINHLKEDSLAFKVAFQRALIRAYLDFVTIEGADLPDTDAEDDSGEDDDTNENNGIDTPTDAASPEGLPLTRAKQFVHALNGLVATAPEFLSVKASLKVAGVDFYLWHGSLYNRGADAIDFTLGASDRAREIVFLAAAFHLCKEERDESIRTGFDAFWDALPASNTGIHRKIWRAVERRFASDKGAGGRIVTERDAYSAEDAIREAEIRARWLWKALGMPSGPAKKASSASHSSKKTKKK